MTNHDDDDFTEENRLRLLRAPPPPTSDAVFAAAVQARISKTTTWSWRAPVLVTATAMVVVGVVARRSDVEPAEAWLVDVANHDDVFAFAELDGSTDQELSQVERQLDEALWRHNNRSGT
jgi:hypothetical protein